MDAMAAIRERRSVREFAARPVARGVIESIIDCGRLAPTARGEEPWEFIAVTQPERLFVLELNKLPFFTAVRETKCRLLMRKLRRHVMKELILNSSLPHYT